MNFWHRLKCLRPSYRRAQEEEMNRELQSLAEMAEPGELGNLTRVGEETRAAWSWIWLEQLYRDAQYAFRTMRHNPGFTATAVLSLALGIGANTAIFSLIDAIMLRWLPVGNPQELVQLKMRSPHAASPPGESFSYAMVTALTEQTDTFAHLAGFFGYSFEVGPRGSVNRVPGAWVTGDYYETLGLNPAIGRLLQPSDDRPVAPIVAVIGYGYWERQFASNPGVIGQPVQVNGVPVTIAGVSPRGFTGTNVGAIADITLAVAALPRIDPDNAGLLNPGNFWLRILARPRRNLSVSQATAQLSALWPRISGPCDPSAMAADNAERNGGVDFRTGARWNRLHSYLRELFRRPLLVLMAVAALVLLIACANVASLLLARATARQREISVRLDIGAGRWRIVRQLLTESTLLSSLGAALGICFAWLTSRFLLDTLSAGGNYASDPFPAVFGLCPNWRVLGFTTALGGPGPRTMRDHPARRFTTQSAHVQHAPGLPELRTAAGPGDVQAGISGVAMGSEILPGIGSHESAIFLWQRRLHVQADGHADLLLLVAGRSGRLLEMA